MSGQNWALALSSFVVSAALGATSAETLRDVEYARPGGVPLRFDASIPSGPGPFPAAILVHGGAWVRGDRKTYVAPLFRPLEDAGIAWFSISYRLANDPLQFGVAIRDVEAAVRFLKQHADEYRIDPNRIALIGESAGGHLAAMAALSADPEVAVKAVVGLYPPTDLVSLAKTSELVPPAIQRALQGSPLEGLILARLAQLSPFDNVRAGMPPFLLIHGTADPLVPIQQSRAMCKRMTGVGGDCEVFAVEGGGHGIRWWESRSALAAPYKREMIRWLRARLDPRAETVAGLGFAR